MRNRTIAGVCSGLADYLEVNTTIVRIIAVCSIFILGPYALLAYVVGWIAMEPNPAPRSNGIRYGGRRSRRAGYRSRRRRHRFAASRLSSSRSDDGDQDADLYGDTGDGSDDPLYSGSGSPAAAARGRRERHTRHNPEPETVNQESVERCTDLFYALESRMRSLEAFITSKKFRLHCEINRI
jgi:phage shock protein PspC (stress-responsive transcriptional regulator)